jgi:hypothetical protein
VEIEKQGADDENLGIVTSIKVYVNKQVEELKKLVAL